MAIATSEHDLINEALNRLGQKRLTSVQIVTPDSKVSRLVAHSYENHRNALLRDHPWNFAMERVTLTATGTAPDWGFDYAYDLPDGTAPANVTYCERVTHIDDDLFWGWGWGSGWYQPDSVRLRYKIEQRQILSDIGDTLSILFIGRVTDAAQMDPMFKDALSLRLASAWCEAVTSANTLKADLQSELNVILREARSIDGQEGTPDGLESTDFLRARAG